MVNINKLAQVGFAKKYSAGEAFFYEGDQGNDMFIILTGKVKIHISSDDSFHLLGPGDFFGEISLLEELPRSTSAFGKYHTTAPQSNGCKGKIIATFN
jgi:CRP-like cAMP-binding protein